MLFTHGFAASAQMFKRNVGALAGDHTVITWDVRGHGASDSPSDPGAYSAALSIGDMAALLDAAGAETAVVAGHSLGGYLSLEFHLAQPERVDALVLIDTGPGYRRGEPRDEWNGLAERYATAFEDQGLGALGDSEELTPGVHRDASGLARAARGILTQHDAQVIESLPSIGVPTLVVVGEHDTPFLDGSRYMASKIPGASLAVIAGARHAPTVSHPHEFNARLREFLDDRELSPASDRRAARARATSSDSRPARSRSPEAT